MGQILPYLVQFERESSIDIAGIDDHDNFMFIHAILVLMMASSVNTNDVRWLEDSGLIWTLKGLESAGLVPYELAETNGWTQQCVKVMWKLNCFLLKLIGCRDKSNFMLDLFAPTEGWSHPSTTGIARLVDECNVQMLKDVFYIVTCVTTQDDTDLAVSPRDKSSRTDGIPIKADEVLSRAPACPTIDSEECEIGVCDHFIGLLPVIGRTLPILGENACLHPECADDPSRECEDREGGMPV